MAVVRIPERKETLHAAADVARALAAIGVDFTPVGIRPEVAAAPAERVLDSLAPEIAALKERGGYVAADVIDVGPETPNLSAMLAKFSKEHWHDEDEVRLVVSGRGVFHIHPKDAPVHAIEVAAGDAIRVPAGTLHWFHLCEPPAIRAVRLFKDPAGWVPRYTESGAERGHQPVCLGPSYVPV